MKKKTYFLMVSKVFLAGHPRVGEPTNFRQQILEGKKIHTIRAGDYWRKVVEEVNAGKAVLSVREWSGLPYRSKQVEFARYEKLGWQEIYVARYCSDETPCAVCVDEKTSLKGLRLLQLAENDGFDKGSRDLLHWLAPLWKPWKPFEGGIIHFTDFRY